MAKRKGRAAKPDRTNRTPKKRSTPDWAPSFLETLADVGVIKWACKAAKIGRSTVYERRDQDPAFAAAMADALEDADDELEGSARKRAIEGDNALTMFILKARRYKDTTRHEVSGPGGGPIVQVIRDIGEEPDA